MDETGGRSTKMEWQGKHEYMVTQRLVMDKKVRADSRQEAICRALDEGILSFDLVTETTTAKQIKPRD